MFVSESKASKMTGLARSTIERFREEIIYIDGVETNLLNPTRCSNIYYYDEIDMEKLWIIKMFKSLGKNREEIVKEMSNPNFNKREFLSNTVNELSELINIAKAYMETGLSYEVLSLVGLEETSCDQINDILSIVFKMMNELTNQLIESSYEEHFENNSFIEDLFENLIEYCLEEVSPYNIKVQKTINEFCISLFDNKYYSKQILKTIVYLFVRTFEEEKDSDLEDLIDYFEKSFNYFIDNFIPNKDIINLDEVTVSDKYEELAYQGKQAGSVEIQNEIEKIALYLYFSSFKNWKLTLDVLREISKLLDSDELINKYDNGNKKGILHFTSVAIKVFLNSKSKQLEFN